MMRTHILANDLVLIDLNATEHVALAHALCKLMSLIEPCDIETVLLSETEEAYEFVYSVYVLDAGARLSGIEWLPYEDPEDTNGIIQGAKPTLGIAYAPNGSTWCLTTAQLRFVELAMAAEAHFAKVAENSARLPADMAWPVVA